MILDRLENADRYAAVHPLFAKAFEFLRRKDLAALPPGRHDVDGDRLYALVVRAYGAGHEKAALETHRRYIDIQCILSGEDEMGWRALGECAGGKGYDATKDVEFFADTPVVWCPVHTGGFAVFFPPDAHAPGGGMGPIHKVVVKVLDQE